MSDRYIDDLDVRMDAVEFRQRLESSQRKKEQALINDGPKFTSEMTPRDQIISLDRLWNPND